MANGIPALGPNRSEWVQDQIQANDFQGAIDSIIHFKFMDYEVDPELLENKTMVFDAAMRGQDGHHKMPSWDYGRNKADPAFVKIGPSAFSSLAFLYSVMMHEYQHVLYHQSLENQRVANKNRGQGGDYTGEVEAYAWELLNLTQTGLNAFPEDIASVWRELNSEYWKLDAPTQQKMKALVQRALAEARRFATGQHPLVPFAQP